MAASVHPLGARCGSYPACGPAQQHLGAVVQKAGATCHHHIARSQPAGDGEARTVVRAYLHRAHYPAGLGINQRDE